MKKSIAFISAAFMLLLSACQKEEQQTALTGTISGTLTTYDPATPLVTTPAEGIKLWLVDYDFPMDTVTYIGNEKAILDSTYSDAQGNYSFSHLSFGNYAVVPIPDTADYRFEPTDPELPIALTEADPSKEVSYSAPWPGGENSTFNVYVTITNQDSSNATYYKNGRQSFYLFIPYIEYNYNFHLYQCLTFLFNPYYLTHKFHICAEPGLTNIPYGYTHLIETQTNNFLFDFYNSNDAWLESYWITQDLSNTPAESWWTIDLAAHTITRDSISVNPQKTTTIANKKTSK